MDASALINVILGVMILSAGGAIKYLLSKLDTARQVIDAKDQTIATQARQIDRLEVSALIQDKLLSRLPSPNFGSVSDRPRGDE